MKYFRAHSSFLRKVIRAKTKDDLGGNKKGDIVGAMNMNKIRTITVFLFAMLYGRIIKQNSWKNFELTRFISRSLSLLFTVSMHLSDNHPFILIFDVMKSPIVDGSSLMRRLWCKRHDTYVRFIKLYYLYSKVSVKNSNVPRRDTKNPWLFSKIFYFF